MKDETPLLCQKCKQVRFYVLFFFEILIFFYFSRIVKEKKLNLYLVLRSQQLVKAIKRRVKGQKMAKAHQRGKKARNQKNERIAIFVYLPIFIFLKKKKFQRVLEI